jgi:hypothetical protein
VAIERDAMTASKRRRFRCSLRTMFVAVTVLGAGLGWTAYQLNWIRERRAVVLRADILSFRSFSGEPFARPPWSLCPFGARGYKAVDLLIVDDNRTRPSEMDSKMDDPRLTPGERGELLRLQRLFPEAYVAPWFRMTQAGMDKATRQGAR